jgi:short-subunit dehydrogenase
VAADLTVYDQLYNLFAQTINAFNRLDILVNNAGFGEFGRLSDANFSSPYQSVTAIDETAVLQLTQLFIPYLNQTNGTITHISSSSLNNPVTN